MEDNSPPKPLSGPPNAAAVPAAVTETLDHSAGSSLPAHSAATPLETRVASLASALRRARIENAEHSSARVDVRAMEIARLEMLSEALEPVLAQIPEDCDLFDVAVAPGATPRMFVDQIGFVEMANDRRTYRFRQDTRHGRITLIESDRIGEIVGAVTDYIAHRLIEREKALAIDYASGGAVANLRRKTPATPPRHPLMASLNASNGFRAYIFLVETLAATVFFSLLAAIAWWVYRTTPVG
jgi:hypothetical protein